MGVLEEFRLAAENDDEVSTVSVDIFDTLLYRTTLPEISKFMRFSQHKSRLFESVEGGGKITPEYLHLLRLYAARTVYRNKSMTKGAREATLDEIYQIMFSGLTMELKLSTTQSRALIRQFRVIEIENEITDLSVNRRLAEILKTAKTRGKRIIAISDMYLLHDDIIQLLDHFDLTDTFDKIYVSSEFGYGKAAGALFQDALEDYPTGAMIHIGDNWHSDFSMANHKEIRGYFYPRSKSWRFTKRLRSALAGVVYGKAQ